MRGKQIFFVVVLALCTSTLCVCVGRIGGEVPLFNVVLINDENFICPLPRPTPIPSNRKKGDTAHTIPSNRKKERDDPGQVFGSIMT
jgi:hypothetical protein